MILSNEEKIFIDSFEEDFTREKVLEFLKSCECEDKEVEKFRDELKGKVSKLTDEEFLKEINTIN